MDTDNTEVPFKPHPYSGPCSGAVLPQSTPEALSKALLYVVVVGKVSKDSGMKSKETEEAGGKGRGQRFLNVVFLTVSSRACPYRKRLALLSPGYLDRVSN